MKRVIISDWRLTKHTGMFHSRNTMRRKPRILVSATREAWDLAEKECGTLAKWCRKNKVIPAAKARLKLDGIHEINFKPYWWKHSGGKYGHPGFNLYYPNDVREPKFTLVVYLTVEEQQDN